MIVHSQAPNPPLPAGLGDITQQLNQSELAVLLNLLQSQTDLSVPQMAQLLNVHSNPEMQQQLEALNQSITALTEATAQQQQQQREPAAAAEETAEEPPAEVPEEQQTPEAASAQGDMQNVLAVLLSQLMKSQEPGITLEESNGEKSSEQRGGRKSPPRHPEESAGKWMGTAGVGSRESIPQSLECWERRQQGCGWMDGRREGGCEEIKASPPRCGKCWTAQEVGQLQRGKNDPKICECCTVSGAVKMNWRFWGLSKNAREVWRVSSSSKPPPAISLHVQGVFLHRVLLHLCCFSQLFFIPSLFKKKL